MSWKILDFLDSRAVVKLLSSNRKLAFTSMSGSDRHTSKQKVYNWPSNKSDLRSHHDRLASSRPSHAIRKTISINRAPEPQSRSDRRDTLATDLRLTSYALRLISDRPTTGSRPPRVTCVTRQKFAWDKKKSRVTCDRFMTVPNGTRGHRVNYDQPAKTCDQTRIELRVGSLASEIDKFHERFWRPKAVVELVDFNG